MAAQNQIIELRTDKKGNENTLNISDQLIELQKDQKKHDEKYHKEVCALTVHQRINHMALHFAKYTGQLAQISTSSPPINQEMLQRTVVDTFVISMICANMFNLNLSNHIQEIADKHIVNLRDLGMHLGESTKIKKSGFGWYMVSLAVANGNIAKACEKLDHLEAYPYKEEILKNVIEIVKSTMMAAAQLNFDLDTATRQRWEEVAKRSIFYEKP